MFKKIKGAYDKTKKIEDLEKNISDLEKKTGSMNNAILALLTICFNVGEKAGMYIRCYDCDDTIKVSEDGTLPYFDITTDGFRCVDCISKHN